jgi:hypothetical protein
MTRPHFVSAGAVLVLFCLGFLSAAPGAKAEQPIDSRTWVVSAGEEFTRSPRVVVDPRGGVRVFYAAWLGDSPPPGNGRNANAVMYTRSDGEVWTKPVDVLVPPDSSDSGVLVNGLLFQPATRQLHVLWRSDQGLYLSSADLDDAASARSWRTQVLYRGSSYWGSLALDSDNRIHVVYDAEFRNLYHTSTDNDGVTWSDPTLIAGVPADRVAYSGTRLVIDRHDYLHLVWEEAVQEADWNPVAVWYARSADAGADWRIFEVARSAAGERTTGGINVGTGKDDEIHLVWNRGVGSSDGRYHRLSTDSGQTWAEPRLLWPNQEVPGGLAGWGFPLLDGAGVLHLIMVAGKGLAESQGGEVLATLTHMTWDGASWTQPAVLTTCEFPDATVSHDSVLHAVCPTFDGTNRIKYIRVTTGAPPLPSSTPPVRSSTPAPGRAPAEAQVAAGKGAATSNPTPVQPTPNRFGTPTQTPARAFSDGPPSGTSGPSSAILLSAAAALLVIVPTVIGQRIKRGNRR